MARVECSTEGCGTITVALRAQSRAKCSACKEAVKRACSTPRYGGQALKHRTRVRMDAAYKALLELGGESIAREVANLIGWMNSQAAGHYLRMHPRVEKAGRVPGANAHIWRARGEA